MTAESLRLATIQRPSGSELRVTVEPHLQSGGRMAVITLVPSNGVIGPRIALRPSEIGKLATALGSASAMLCGTGAAGHRTVIDADHARQLAEDRELF